LDIHTNDDWNSQNIYHTVPIQNKAPFSVFTTSTLYYIISNDI